MATTTTSDADVERTESTRAEIVGQGNQFQNSAWPAHATLNDRRATDAYSMCNDAGSATLDGRSTTHNGDPRAPTPLPAQHGGPK
jgi:hypothetical protein